MVYILNLKYPRENFIVNMLSGFILYKRIYPAVLFIIIKYDFYYKNLRINYLLIKKNRYKIGLHFMVLSYKKNDSI